MGDSADRFLAFAKRTNLVRVLTLYFSAAFVALQLVDMFADRLLLPNWVFTVTLAAVIVGLPLTLFAAISYARNRTPASVNARAEVGEHVVEPHHALTWQRVGIIVLSIFALWGLVAAAWLLIGPSRPASGSGEIAQGSLQVSVDPASAVVALKPVMPIDSFDLRATTPLESHNAVRLPAGEYALTVSAPGYNTVDLVTLVRPDSTQPLQAKLVRDEPATHKMVYVPARQGIPAFLIDRFEVTNADYLEFMRAGGYSNASLHAFVDKTGSAGPRGWAGGVYPEGKADHPVVGVSWQEANIYAQWRGKQLPTYEQWWQAALTAGRTYPWGSDAETLAKRANLDLAGTTKVGSHPLGVSWVGAHDMVGNVREWLHDPRGDAAKRIAVGGSWQDPVYLFDPQWLEGFTLNFSNDIIGFRCVKEIK